MKSILISLVVIVCIFFGYNYFNRAKLPQECVDAKAVYFDVVNRFKSLNVDGSFTDSVKELTAIGDRLNELLDSNKRYKRSKIAELRSMCIKSKEHAETALKQLDFLQQFK